MVGRASRAADAPHGAHEDLTDSGHHQSGGHSSPRDVSAPTHEGLNAVAHHGSSSAPTNEDDISCIRSAFEVRLLQRFLASLGPSEGDDGEEENSSVDQIQFTTRVDEGEIDVWAVITSEAKLQSR